MSELETVETRKNKVSLIPSFLSLKGPAIEQAKGNYQQRR